MYWHILTYHGSIIATCVNVFFICLFNTGPTIGLSCKYKYIIYIYIYIHVYLCTYLNICDLILWYPNMIIIVLHCDVKLDNLNLIVYHQIAQFKTIVPYITPNITSFIWETKHDIVFMMPKMHKSMASCDIQHSVALWIHTQIFNRAHREPQRGCCTKQQIKRCRPISGSSTPGAAVCHQQRYLSNLTVWNGHILYTMIIIHD